jgi:hypothetical protein
MVTEAVDTFVAVIILLVMCSLFGLCSVFGCYLCEIYDKSHRGDDNDNNATTTTTATNGNTNPNTTTSVMQFVVTRTQPI